MHQGHKTERTAAERSTRARMAAYELHATHDPRETTEAAPQVFPARQVFLARFEEQVDPTRSLPAAERKRRADAAKTAYFIRLSIKSAKVRRRASTDGPGGGTTA